MTKQDSPMSAYPEPDLEADLADALSPFRAAFARAREEGVTVTEPHRSTVEPHGNGQPDRGPTHEADLVRFEVRIDKRRGKRETRRWNALGAEGWELVAVTGKKAFFKRERLDPAPM